MKKILRGFEQNDGRVDLYLEERTGWWESCMQELREKTCVQFNVTKECQTWRSSTLVSVLHNLLDTRKSPTCSSWPRFQVWNVQPAASMIYDARRQIKLSTSHQR